MIMKFPEDLSNKEVRFEFVIFDIIYILEKIIQSARWLMISMKDGRYPYSFDNYMTCSALDL